MSDTLVTAIISTLVGMILGGAGSNYLGLGPIRKEFSRFGERLAALEATVHALVRQEER